MDLSNDPEGDIIKLKGEIINHFPKCQTFNINLNTFIPLSVIQLENELLMDKSFKHLILYHFNNYISKTKNIQYAKRKTFFEFLKDIIKLEKNINPKEIISNVKTLSQSEDINKEILSIIKDLNEKCKGKDINIGILENREEEEEEEEEDNNEITSLNDIYPFYFIK